MLSSVIIVLVGLNCVAIASNLYVSSYNGNVDSLSVTETDSGLHLSLIDSNTACAPSPAWLTWDDANHVLYCLDEGLIRPNGSISSFQTSDTGSLYLSERRVIPSGPSAGVIYDSGGKNMLALSHYNGSAVSLWDITHDGILSREQQLFFYQGAPGPGPRQSAPHEHQVLLDPTGRYLVVPAFGLDEIQVFSIEGTGIKQLPSSQAAPGSGPRHGAFWSAGGAGQTNPLYFFLLAEITSDLTTYEVTYTETGLNFTELDVTNSYGGAPVPEGNGAAEIVVSPDNRYLVVSNRNGTAIPHESLRFTSSVEEYWDTLASFSIQPNGTLVLEQLVPSGGGYPRHFTFNQEGDRVAVGLQSNSRVVVFDRNVTSGQFGGIMANITLQGEPNCLVWVE